MRTVVIYKESKGPPNVGEVMRTINAVPLGEGCA